MSEMERLQHNTDTSEQVIDLTEKVNEIVDVLNVAAEKEIEQAVKVQIGLIMDVVTETIGVDGHQWSDRPCQTCLAVTSLIGRPFGCYWYQAKKKA